MSDTPPRASTARAASWQARLAARGRRVDKARPIVVEGMLRRVVGLTLEAVGCEAPVGSRCLIDGADGGTIETEVVGFSEGHLYLMPTGILHGVLPNARVRPCPHDSGIPVGDAVLGRVIDASGAPLDGRR